MALWVDDRRNWKLTLLGGIEQARIKLPVRVVVTSRPYPVVDHGNITTLFDSGVKYPPTLGYVEANQPTFEVTKVFMSSKTGKVSYEYWDAQGPSFGVTKVFMSSKTGHINYSQPIESTAPTFAVTRVLRETIRVSYDNRTDLVAVAFDVRKVSIT